MNQFLEALGSIGIALFYPFVVVGVVPLAYVSLLIGCLAWLLFGIRRRILGLFLVNLWASAWVMVLLIRMVI